jgi:lysine 2,3-aminomutase
MAHVRVLRVHSRVPVAAPEMLDDGVIETLASSSKPVFMVFHCNHAEELTPRVRRAITHLRDAGLSLLSQSVLLAGVNDSVAALESLFRTLVEVGIKPYYLHQLDAAPGTSQFAVPIARGRALMKSLRARVSGLALPTFVVDVPGGSGKVPIGPDYLRGVDGGFERVEGLDGETHHLPPAVTEPCQ